MAAAVKRGSKVMIFHCPPPVRAWLEKAAAKNYTTMTAMLIRSICEAMERDKAMQSKSINRRERETEQA